MSIIWKVGDRAIFGYNPIGGHWSERALARVGKTGTIVRAPYQGRRCMRVHFQADDGDFFRPKVKNVFPIIDPPMPAIKHARERELVYVLK